MTGRLLETHVVRLSAALGGPQHADNPPLYYFYGGPGAGKSILLRQMMRETAKSQLGQLALDLRRLPICSGPLGLLQVLAQTFGLPPLPTDNLEDAAAFLAQHMPAPLLVYFDHFEEMAGWESWLYQHLIAPTRSKALYIIAGAYDLSDLWHKEGGVPAMLPAFSVDDVNNYLKASFQLTGDEVPKGVYQLTEGWPLAVGMVSEILTRMSGQPSKVHDFLDDPQKTGAKALKTLAIQLLENLDSDESRRLSLYSLFPPDEALYHALGETFDLPRFRFLPDPGPTLTRFIKLALRSMDPDNYSRLASAGSRYYRSRYGETKERSDLVHALLLGLQADEAEGYWQILGVISETIKVNPAFGESLLRAAQTQPASKAVKADLKEDLDTLRGYVAKDYKRAQRLIDRLGNVKGFSGWGKIEIGRF